MNVPIVRWLPTAAADGPTNMAADELLLELAETGNGSLRFYTWEPPTLSLGYFQTADLRLSDARLRDVPFVRRQTGGGAILHHHELTYAIALPAGPPWHSKESWLCRFHHAVFAALEGLGVHSQLLGCSEEQGNDDLLCFHHHTAGDIVVRSDKVVGSAQRRRRGALLQHGSILLRQSPHTPSLPGIIDRSAINLPPEQLEERIVGELSRQTGWEFRPGEWSPAERGHIARIAREKYAADLWNRKR